MEEKEMHWFAMAIPVAAAAVLYFKYHKRAVWWEFLILFAITTVLILIFKFTAETMQTMDTEYWGGWITRAEYYEEWNEKVACTHAKYETYTDSDGNIQSRFVGYEHLYDVDYHGPYWQAFESNGFAISINRMKFEELAGKFGNRNFVDLHRDYHTIDGDKYVAAWAGSEENIEPAVTVHSYENRIQASNSVFNFPELSKTEVKENSLFNYPKVTGFYYCPSIIGNGGQTYIEALKKLDIWNAKLGAKKQARMWVLIFVDKPMQAGFLQEQYWKGGNKNEFVMTIGVDNAFNVQWSHVFSWTEAEELKVEARNFAISLEKLDLVKIVDWLAPQIDKKFVRKPFAEFSYLTVDPPMWSIAVIYLITIALNSGLAIWIVMNQYSE
ncbi:MAG: hypothetical protein Q8N98_01895 [bacterium]|nr:hypothetical protein [bacterium]